MHNVFVLGAGASVDQGVPLMSGFLDRAQDLLVGQRGALESAEAFEMVFNQIHRLKSVYAKSYLDLDNIEELLGAVEVGRIVERLGSVRPSDIEPLQAALVSLIVDTIELSARLPLDEHKAIRPNATIGELAGFVSEHHSKSSSETFGFVTLNYDALLEHALAWHGLAVDFGLEDEPILGAVPVLKLHGSVAWGECVECERIITKPAETYSQQMTRTRDNHAHLLLSRWIRRQHHCKTPLQPLIVPPTWRKAAFSGDLMKVWKRAAREFERAERLFIVGYSMPASDAFFRYLFAIATDSDARLRELWIVNPDDDVRQRLTFVGRGVQKGLRVLGEFSKAWPVMRATFADLPRTGTSTVRIRN